MTIFKPAQTTVGSFARAVLVALLSATAARAGAVYFDLVVDPVNTAFTGIPATNGFAGTSGLAGGGTWHLYAIDDTDGSFGIRGFSVLLNPGAGGTIPTIINRSPVTTWLGDDSGDPLGTGFDDLRSNLFQRVSGYQGLGTPNPLPVGGFGISASDFRLATGQQDFTGTTNGQWGKYADYNFGNPVTLPSGHTRYPLFLGEGTYTGAAPTIDFATPVVNGGTFVDSWTNADLSTSAVATQLETYPRPPQCACGIGVSIGTFNNVDPNNPGFIDYTFTTSYIDLPSSPNNPPLVWEGLGFSNQGMPGGAQPATFDPATRKFHWNTVNAKPGSYSWTVRASAEGYGGVGYVYVTIIPEPATLALVVPALLSLLAMGRRRPA